MTLAPPHMDQALQKQKHTSFIHVPIWPLPSRRLAFCWEKHMHRHAQQKVIGAVVVEYTGHSTSQTQQWEGSLEEVVST